MENHLEGMPDTVLRAKGIVPTTEGPHELQYGTHYCSLSPSETNDYSLVVIGTDLMYQWYITKCVNHDTSLYRYRVYWIR